MIDVEALLEAERKHVQSVEVPEHLEQRLRNALDVPAKRKLPRLRRFRLAVALVMILLFSYPMDALIYQGKRMVDYEPLMDSSLKTLSVSRQGQVIGEARTLQDGSVLTLDTLMLDDNQMILFYSVANPDGAAEAEPGFCQVEFKGQFGTYSPNSSSGRVSSDHTRLQVIAYYDTPFLLEKNLTATLMDAHAFQPEAEPLVVKLKWNEAMGHSLKADLKSEFKLPGTTIKLKSIQASPTTTVLKGSIQSLSELAFDQVRGQRQMPWGLELQLLADGVPLSSQSSGMRTDMQGITFSYHYGPLPQDLKHLEARLVQYDAEHEVDQTLALQESSLPATTEVSGKSVTIESVNSANGSTRVTLSTEADVLLSRVALLIGDQSVDLKETIGSSEIKLADGAIRHTRTLVFPKEGEAASLKISRIRYMENSSQTVDIPLN